MTLSQINIAVRKSVLDLVVRKQASLQPPDRQLASALIWFKNSLRESGGSSAKFCLATQRYSPAYPETTGYWINTLCDVRTHYPDIMHSVFASREIEMELAGWLQSIQRDDGAFPGSYGDLDRQPPVVFNTGQILHGLIAVVRYAGNDANLFDSIVRASKWLVSVQEPDGAWRRNSRCQLSSNTRTAWALILAGRLLSDDSYVDAGRRNVTYALTHLNERFYFTSNGFRSDRPAFTHTIAYAIEGMLACGILESKSAWIDAAENAYDALLPYVASDGRLAGEFGESFESDDSYVCLTGNCQLAAIGFQLHEVRGNRVHLDNANRLLDFVRRHQLTSRSAGVDGGIPGSWPLKGRYNPYKVPNWAVKFFVDALIAHDRSGE